MKGGWQPYAKRAGTGRPPGAALTAMTRGKPFLAPHPRDVHRRAQKQSSKLLKAARARRR